MTTSKLSISRKACLAAVLAAGVLVVSACVYDNNPPGPSGGRGTNWENPPGPAGGPGTSPDRYGYWHGHYYYRMGDQWTLWNDRDQCWYPDPDRNPPGPVNGRGTNWENPPGRQGGPGSSPDRYGRCR
jgi:hypothetical protein